MKKVYCVYIFCLNLFCFATFPQFEAQVHSGVLVDYTSLFSSYPIQNKWLNAMAATLEPSSGTSDEKRIAGRLNVFKAFTPDTKVRSDGYLGYAAPGNSVSGAYMFPRYMCIGHLGLNFSGGTVYSWYRNNEPSWSLLGYANNSNWQADAGPKIDITGYVDKILSPKLTLYSDESNHMLCGTWASVPTNMVNASYSNDGKGILINSGPAFDDANAKYVPQGYLSCSDSLITSGAKLYTYFITFYPENLNPSSYWMFYKEVLYINGEQKFSNQFGQYSNPGAMIIPIPANTKYCNVMRFDSSKRCHLAYIMYQPATGYNMFIYRVFNDDGTTAVKRTYSPLSTHSFFTNLPSTIDLRLLNNNGTEIPTILVSAKNGTSLFTIASNGALVTDASYFVDYISTANAQFVDYTYSIDASYANYEQYKHLNGNKYIICAIAYPEGTLNNNNVNVGNNLIFVISKYSFNAENKLIVSTKVRYEYLNSGNYQGVINDCGKLISFDVKNNHLWITYMTAIPNYQYKYFHMDARILIESIEQKN